MAQHAAHMILQSKPSVIGLWATDGLIWAPFVSTTFFIQNFAVGSLTSGEKPDYLLMKMHLKDKRTELMLCWMYLV